MTAAMPTPMRKPINTWRTALNVVLNIVEEN